LLRRWTRAKVVQISCETGLVKSRLTVELEERLQAEPHIRLRYFGSPYNQNNALFRLSTSLAAPWDSPGITHRRPNWRS
jgi:hypothetical protein